MLTAIAQGPSTSLRERSSRSSMRPNLSALCLPAIALAFMPSIPKPASPTKPIPAANDTV